MVTVAEDEIREVALVPLVEETGIVVLRLLTAPHIKRLVHDDDTHRVAHIQEFRCRGIMRRAYAVHTHCLQFREFTVQGILAEGSTQTAEVMMLADTIDLEVLAIEPEARLWIEFEVTEARGGLHLINDLACHQQLRANLIYIWVFTRPFAGLLDICWFAIGIQPRVLDGDLLVGGVLIIHRDLTVVHIDTPVLHVDGMSLREPHMTVDATARIPAGVWLI